jgi:hypothetical protein
VAALRPTHHRPACCALVRHAQPPASLNGFGLQRVNATRLELIDSASDRYGALAAWGQALHDCPAQLDGIIWRSRHYDDADSFMLFADRVRRGEPRAIEPPLSLAVGKGLELRSLRRQCR